MAQFQVPQFIETEDKIVGPLTLRQFIYLAAAGLIGFLTFFILKTFLWLIITAIIGTLAAILAFVKVNGQPMHRVIMSAIKYFWHPRFYLWQPKEEKIELPKAPKIKIPKIKAEAKPPAEPQVAPLAASAPIAPLTAPKPVTPPTEVVETAPPVVVEEKIKEDRRPLLKTLWLKIQTSAQAIKPAAKETKLEEKFAVIRKITGEREKVRRVDYR